MIRIIIATNPADDQVTEYLDAWHKKVVNFAKKQANTQIFELNKKEANRISLTELIERKNPHLVIFNGHGSYDSIFGFDQGILIKCDENEILLKNKIVHALACDSGKKLGPQSIKVGALAYLGYKEQFKFAFINNSNEEKSQDKIANLFLEPAFKVVFSLLQGFSAKKAFDESQKACLNNLRSVIAKKSLKLNQAIAPRLFHNLTHQVCLGSDEAYF